MNLSLQPLDEHNLRDVNRCDNTFTVDSRLVLQAEDAVIRYTVVAVPPYQKRYPVEALDYTPYLTDPDKAIFFAKADGRLAGQVIVRKNWNHYAFVDDITVDTGFRRKGVGRALLQHAVDWARSRQWAGVMLETQNNNLGACRLYERCGFELAGFDRGLYQGLNPSTDEIALYWYLLFAAEA